MSRSSLQPPAIVTEPRLRLRHDLSKPVSGIPNTDIHDIIFDDSKVQPYVGTSKIGLFAVWYTTNPNHENENCHNGQKVRNTLYLHHHGFGSLDESTQIFIFLSIPRHICIIY